MLDNYEVNTNFEDIQTVKLTLQAWKFSKTFSVTVIGNIRGLSVINSAVENLDELLYNEQGEGYVLYLKDKEGSVLEMQDESERGSEFLQDLVVYAEITEIN